SLFHSSDFFKFELQSMFMRGVNKIDGQNLTRIYQELIYDTTRVMNVQQLRIILVFVGFCQATKCFKLVNTVIEEDQSW
ncbi:unnamed protein product, partial [Porites lobata]